MITYCELDLDKINSILKQKRWTSLDLAREAGINELYIYRIMKGKTKPLPETAYKIAQALNTEPLHVTPEDIIVQTICSSPEKFMKRNADNKGITSGSM